MQVSGSRGSLEKAGSLPGPRLELRNNRGDTIFFAQGWFRNNSNDDDDDDDKNIGEHLFCKTNGFIICLTSVLVLYIF